MKNFLFIFILFGCSLWHSALAQEAQVTGTVKDASSNEALPGLTVQVKGTSTGTVTDVNGTFTINVKPSDVLVFSFIGYLTQEVPVNNKTVINVQLQQDLAQLEEVVVIGYGTQKKSDLTGSVERVNAETFQNQAMTQVTDMLTGTVAGFYGNQNASARGGSSMEIRGPSSLTAGTDPLLVLDGVIYKGSLADINPNDIETIDILKDASSAAVYGSKAASGVILITTKRGKTGKPTINFSTRVGVAESTNERRGIGPEEYVQFRKDYFRTIFPKTPYHFYTNPDELPEGMTVDDWRKLSNNPLPDNTREYMARLRFFPIEQENYLAGKTVDWYDVVMRPALRQSHDLSIGGGAENISYYWSVGYTDNEGIILGDDFSAVRSKLNVDFKINKWLNVGVNTQFSNRDESSVPGSLGFYGNSPYGREFDENGNLERLPHGHTSHPLLEYYRQDRLRKINSLFTNLHADISLPLGITYTVSFQPRFETMKDLRFTTTDRRVGGEPNEDLSRGNRDEYSHYEWMVDNLLKWNKQVGIHTFDVTLLHNVEESQRWSSRTSNLNFTPTEALGYHALQLGNGPGIINDDYRFTGDAVMARLNYTLLGKYLFTASVRRDGYSAFGQKNPRATFPAVALAWQVSEEDFFNFDLINRMKLRLS
jgi:TonB-dependent starch-binding outer membrane protein SusC